MQHKRIKLLLLWVEDVCKVSSGSLYICCRHRLCRLAIHCSATEHAHSTPLLLVLLLRMLPTPWAWCCNGHTHKRTHTHSPPTCPHAHRHVNTHTNTHTESRDNLAFCLSVLQSSPHSSVEHTVQRVS